MLKNRNYINILKTLNPLKILIFCSQLHSRSLSFKVKGTHICTRSAVHEAVWTWIGTLFLSLLSYITLSKSLHLSELHFSPVGHRDANACPSVLWSGLNELAESLAHCRCLSDIHFLTSVKAKVQALLSFENTGARISRPKILGLIELNKVGQKQN